MLRKTIFAAAAVTFCFAAFAASTDASAAGRFGGFKNHNAGRMLAGHSHRHIGTGGLVRRTGTRKKEGCGDAECGGGVVPLSDEIVLRGCHLNGLVPPPWCEGVPGMPRPKNHGLRY